MNFKKVTLIALLSSVFFTACNSDEVPRTKTSLGAYDKGVLILNEGGYGYNNASVSYLSNTYSVFQNDIFTVVNSTKLGDTAQNIGFYNNKAYIVLSTSNKIEVVNRFTMKHEAIISTGLSTPRYITFVNGKGYVTNWGSGSNASDDFVAVINLTNNSVSGTISVAEGPEKVAVNGSNLYIAHQGGYSQGKTVSVINTSSDTVSNTITVGDVPNAIQVHDGLLYVLCGGNPSWTDSETAGKLIKINLSNNSIKSTIDFPATVHPSNLDIYENKLYYTVGKGIYTAGHYDTTLPTTPVFSTSGSIYGFEVENNTIYVADAKDYSSAGSVYTYSLTGTQTHSYTVGVIPSGFYFNN